jgi:enoyl-[acyl-carrier-protein] reductase (NADH)
MNSYRDTLRKILESIDYTEDKDTFIEEFMRILQLKVVAALVQKLTPDKQREIEKLLEEESKIVLENYFTEEEIKSTISKISKELGEEYIKSIAHTLSESQKETLDGVLREVSKQADS